jgi:hypothetical protein
MRDIMKKFFGVNIQLRECQKPPVVGLFFYNLIGLGKIE